MLAKLGLLEDIPACTDLTTAPWVRDAGVTVLEQPFFARSTIATAGGCLAAHYLAAWVIARLDGLFTKSGPRLHRCRRVPRLGWSSAEGCKP
ncbi:hypothetical protein AA12717_0791 [Gluconacetobacter sacchari DSM 12717]|uniref:DJ-1/PfpI family protein n=1 Tax=Gluconacetobacter sacchari DSM 12717 TaxID=1307940 RepID=A0ABQ0P463_9PROT|nr:hypothetical protein [Gluconacetobacter sacchari]GBQ21159.1 hypothetical protein AA12717_0791 [Gluconacetobacter sacchari DSM 12717]